MKFIEHLQGLFAAKISLIKGVFSLLVLEAKLAKLNIYPLLVHLVLIIPLILTVWLMVMVVLGYLFFTFIYNQLLMTILMVLFLNVILLIIVIYKIKNIIHLMSFNKTRSTLHALI